MCGNEPCAHEREFAGTQRDTLTSFIKTSGALVAMTTERDAALARNERQRATLSAIRAIVADPDAALVVDRVRAALEPQPKGTK